MAKYGGAAAMYFVSKKLKKRHNITDERAALYGVGFKRVQRVRFKSNGVGCNFVMNGGQKLVDSRKH